MPHLSAPLDADSALAQGLAWHLRHWALKLGADEAAADQVGTLGAALVQATRQGHVCLPLAQLAPVNPLLPRAALLATGVIGTPSTPGACPLILDDANRVYLHRDFDLEQRLARRLLRAAQAAPQPLTEEARTRLAALFPRAPGSAANTPDWQQVATALALRQRLLVISGGPGTGKTSTVVKLLACLLAEAPQARIALTAPTGKAAARLGEAVRDHAARHAAQWPAALRLALPQTANTVHRLLGVTPQGFVHHAGRPLALDAVIVDEASMLDLALATHLLEAIPDSARIVLLGDQHQLAAVESGAVFAEVSTDPSLGAACRAALEEACALPPGALQTLLPDAPAVLQDCVVWLERNYRFAPDSAIGRLATQIKRGLADETLAALRTANGNELLWCDDAGATPAPAVQQEWQRGYAHFLQAVQDTPHDGAALAQAFARFRVLCAHREGARGMAAVNAALDAHAQQVLAPLLAHHPGAPGSGFYPGRPVLVLRNERLLQLFNGDIGITLPAAAGQAGLVAAFAQADGSVRRIPVQRLPEHQSAWAMTVHKAQGSEFDAVLVLLPQARSEVLTRELLYTAVTRARCRVVLAGSATVIAAAIDARTQRHGGLTARLREAADEQPCRAP